MNGLNVNLRQQNHLETHCILIPTNIRLMSLLPKPPGDMRVVPRSSFPARSARTTQSLAAPSGFFLSWLLLQVSKKQIWKWLNPILMPMREPKKETNKQTNELATALCLLPGQNHKRLDWQEITKIRNFKPQHLRFICRWLWRLENKEDHQEDYRPDKSVCN